MRNRYAAIGHALTFDTWRSVACEQGLTDSQAADPNASVGRLGGRQLCSTTRNQAQPLRNQTRSTVKLKTWQIVRRSDAPDWNHTCAAGFPTGVPVAAPWPPGDRGTTRAIIDFRSIELAAPDSREVTDCLCENISNSPTYATTHEET
jgi:hypothetical protein